MEACKPARRGLGGYAQRDRTRHRLSSARSVGGALHDRHTLELGRSRLTRGQGSMIGKQYETTGYDSASSRVTRRPATDRQQAIQHGRISKKR